MTKKDFDIEVQFDVAKDPLVDAWLGLMRKSPDPYGEIGHPEAPPSEMVELLAMWVESIIASIGKAPSRSELIQIIARKLRDDTHRSEVLKTVTDLWNGVAAGNAAVERFVTVGNSGEVPTPRPGSVILSYERYPREYDEWIKGRLNSSTVSDFPPFMEGVRYVGVEPPSAESRAAEEDGRQYLRKKAPGYKHPAKLKKAINPLLAGLIKTAKKDNS